jgi:hypothetical protein
MNKFSVEFVESSSTFEVIRWKDTAVPGSIWGEVIYKADNFETANTVCDQHILDSDPAYQVWLEQQASEFA